MTRQPSPRDAEGRAVVTLEYRGTEYTCDLEWTSAPDGSGWGLTSVSPEVDRATADEIAWQAVHELDRQNAESWFEARVEALAGW